MKRKSFTVAVTGFGPYREYDYNTSISVRDGLPSHIVRKNHPPIHILKYPHDINCIYTEVLSLVPQLWSGQPSVFEPGSASTKPLEIDLMIHIGMHPDDDGWFLEKRARRGKYEQPGDDGKMLARDALRGHPEKLFVDFDVEDLATKVREMVNVSPSLSTNETMPTVETKNSNKDDDTIVKTSYDAGLYFCELISFLSLSVLEKRQEFGRVVFLHVPKKRDEESIARGIKVAIALITVCVDSLPGNYGKSQN
ncbi:MAG: hypothetical protein Q9222_002981 [Ikaeria aurantiellina]